MICGGSARQKWSNGMRITDEYAAGLIDARGQIRTSYPDSEKFLPMLRLTTTDAAIAEVLNEHFGDG